jgi:hypothetical protein
MKKRPDNIPTGNTLLYGLAAMREDDSNTYNLLMSTLSPAVVTKGTMNNGIINGTPWSEIVSISDEAFIILEVLNSWNTWVPDDYKIAVDDGPEDLPPPAPGVDRIWPQDTTVWSAQGRSSEWRHFVGWAKESIRYYVTLMNSIAEDRADPAKNDAFDAIMRYHIIEGMSETNKAKVASNSNNDTANQDTSQVSTAEETGLMGTLGNMV